MQDPPFDSGSFAKGVTYDASSAGGAAASCKDNVRAGWALLEELGKTETGATVAGAVAGGGMCNRGKY